MVDFFVGGLLDPGCDRDMPLDHLNPNPIWDIQVLKNHTLYQTLWHFRDPNQDGEKLFVLYSMLQFTEYHNNVFCGPTK